MKICILAICCLFFAPPISATSTSDGLAGRWFNSEGRGTLELAFHADGHFDGTIQPNGQPAVTFSGDWSVAGNVINYTYRRISNANGPVEIHDQDEILELTEARLVVKSEKSGKQYAYVRQK
jgi:hypothetical protein